jgi:RimJ/RimL family protein N-acetyltransferase
MNAAAIPRYRFDTDRLVLRPTEAADAGRAFEIQSNWNVTRMLRMASFPPDRDEIAAWFAGHRREWNAGEAYRFAAENQGRLIGVIDIDSVAENEGELGYWFEQAAWGQGYASEAARVVVSFAFVEAGLSRLRSAHAADNMASRNVLTKLGFCPLDMVERHSRPRGGPVMQCRYRLSRDDVDLMQYRS